MNVHNPTAIATLRPLREVVAEYHSKQQALPEAIKTMEQAITGHPDQRIHRWCLRWHPVPAFAVGRTHERPAGSSQVCMAARL